MEALSTTSGAPAAPDFTRDREAARANEEPTIDALKSAVENMDSMSRTTLSNIAALAKAARLSVANVKTVFDLESIDRILRVIWGAAVDAENVLDCYAAEVGCNHADDEDEARLTAIRHTF